MRTIATSITETAGNNCLNSATILIRGNIATIQPAHAELLGPHLRYSTIVFQRSRRRGISQSRKCYDVFEHLDGDRLLVSAGAVPRLADHLRCAGVEVVIHDHRPLNKPAYEVDAEALADGNKKAPGVLNAIQQSFSGVIEVPAGKTRGHLIGLICRLFPAARIIVPNATVEQARDMAAQLGKYVGGEVDAARRSDWRSPCRVVCCTFTSFDKSNPGDWDIVIFPDAIQSTARKIHQIRGEYQAHRVYGFVAPDAALSARTRLQLELLAGQVIWSSVPENPQQRVEVMFVSAPLVARRGAVDQVERKRGLWRDQRRNSLLADIAQGFASRRPELLWERGLFLDDQQPIERWSFGPRVLVAVESLEHAEQLARLLPGWPVLHSNPAASNPVASPRWDDSLVPDRAIITSVRAHKYKTINTDVLIMAAGGTYPTLLGAVVGSGSLLVVDVADDFDRAAKAATRSRIKCYQDQEYTVTAGPRWLVPQ